MLFFGCPAGVLSVLKCRGLQIWPSYPGYTHIYKQYIYTYTCVSHLSSCYGSDIMCTLSLLSISYTTSIILSRSHLLLIFLSNLCSFTVIKHMVTFHASSAFTHLHPPPLSLSFFHFLSASGCLWILKLKSILETCHQHIIYFSQGQEDLLLCTSSSLLEDQSCQA